MAAAANVDQKETHGWTPLMHASYLGNDWEVGYQLKKRVNIDFRGSPRNETALMLASCLMPDLKHKKFLCDGAESSACLKVLNNKTNILKMLLQAGADPNIQDSQGQSALLHLASNKLSELYEDSAVSRTRDTDEKMSSVYHVLTERCSLLLKYKADVDLKDKCGMTALMHAAINKLPRCIEVLLASRAEVNAVDNSGKTALMYGAQISTKCCAILLRHGANLNQQDAQGKTALMYAADSGSSTCNIFRFLLKQGADVKLRNKKGQTALMLGSRFGFFRLKDYELLREQGVDVNEQDEHDETALMYAVDEQPTLECCQLLIRLGADVNRGQKYGKTELMRAVENYMWFGNGDVKDDLFKCCQSMICPNTSDDSLQDVQKKIEVIYAICQDDPKKLEALIENNIDVTFQCIDGTTPLILAVRCRTEECRHVLLCHDGHDIQDNKGMTALMYVMPHLSEFRKCSLAFDIRLHYQFVWERSPLLGLLSDSSVNLTDKKGMTALMYLVRTLADDPYYEPYHDCNDVDDTYLCDRFIKAGADVNHQDNEGKTTLMHAIETWSRPDGYDDFWDFVNSDQQAWCQCLVDNGADIFLQDNQGRTALEYAKIHNAHGAYALLKEISSKVNTHDKGNGAKKL